MLSIKHVTQSYFIKEIQLKKVYIQNKCLITELQESISFL